MSAERLNLLWGITMASGATAQLVARLTSLQAVVLLLVSGLVDRCFVAANRWIEALHVRGRKQMGLPRRSGPGKPSAMRHLRHG